jgi:hypothetical protein
MSIKLKHDSLNICIDLQNPLAAVTHLAKGQRLEEQLESFRTIRAGTSTVSRTEAHLAETD